MASEMRSLSEGHINPRDALEDPSDALGRCHIYDVLRRLPKLGDVGAKNLCLRFKIWPLEPLAEIPLEQRRYLYAALPERVKNFRA